MSNTTNKKTELRSHREHLGLNPVFLVGSVVHHLLNADCVSKSVTKCPSMEINIRHLNISG